MPIHDGADRRQYAVSHHRAVADLDLIQQRYDFAALDFGDWPLAQRRKYQSFKITQAAGRRAHGAGENDLIAILLHSGFELQILQSDFRKRVRLACSPAIGPLPQVLQGNVLPLSGGVRACP